MWPRSNRFTELKEKQVTNVPANPSDFGGTGLEDFGLEDAVIPRLRILHKEAVFEDSLSGEKFDSVYMIILGLVKQRILWHQIVDDDDKPMCRSANFETGFPNLSEDQPREKRFPWAASGFRPEDYPPGPDGKIRLPCSGCNLKEWKSHPDGKRPYCSEQFTLPILYSGDLHGDYVPALVTFQKTSLKPLKSYLSNFARTKNPAFVAITQVGLDMLHRGQTDYSVPKFRKAGETEDDNWRDYAIQYQTMREFLQAEPGSREESEDGVGTPSANVAGPPAQPAAPPQPEPEDVVEGEWTETGADPWKSPPAAAEPPAPAQAQAPPPPPAPAPTPPPAPAPAPAPPAGAADDDLPF